MKLYNLNHRINRLRRFRMIELGVFILQPGGAHHKPTLTRALMPMWVNKSKMPPHPIALSWIYHMQAFMQTRPKSSPKISLTNGTSGEKAKEPVAF